MAAARGEIPLGLPRIRYADLDNSTSVYDYAYAAPSDPTMVAMWWGQASVLIVVCLFISTVFLAIVISRKARKNPYNVYLLGLMLPDLLYSSMCIITCILCALAGHYSSPAMCKWQAWYLLFGCSANAWINAIVASELYTLLRKSNQRAHYHPPTRVSVMRNCAIVYVAMAFFASWWLFFPTVIVGIDSQFGVFCWPSDFDTPTTLFIWLVMIPVAFGIPYIYVAWVCYDVIYRSKLLPPSGMRRMLVIYFLRIILVFAIMWVPSVIAVTFLGYVKVPPWVRWSIGVWSHLQGLVSAAVSMMKPDVMTAVVDLLRCKKARRRWTGENPLPSSFFFGEGFGFRDSGSNRRPSRRVTVTGLTPSEHTSSGLTPSGSFSPGRSKDYLVSKEMAPLEEEEAEGEAEGEAEEQPKPGLGDAASSTQPTEENEGAEDPEEQPFRGVSHTESSTQPTEENEGAENPQDALPA